MVHLYSKKDSYSSFGCVNFGDAQSNNVYVGTSVKSNVFSVAHKLTLAKSMFSDYPRRFLLPGVMIVSEGFLESRSCRELFE